MPAGENIIKSWLNKIVIEKCNEFMSYARSLQKEFDELKRLADGKGSVVDYLRWTNTDDSAYQKSLTVLKLWCTSQENKNDLPEQEKAADLYQRLIIALDKW